MLESEIETEEQVYEAALALGQEGAEAFWTGGDNVLEKAMDKYVAAAAFYKIPVFTNNPEYAFTGAMVNLCANYFNVGQNAGELVLSLTEWLHAGDTELKNDNSEQLFLNLSNLNQMKENWVVSQELLDRADTVLY